MSSDDEDTLLVLSGEVLNPRKDQDTTFNYRHNRFFAGELYFMSRVILRIKKSHVRKLRYFSLKEMVLQEKLIW